MPLTQSGKCRGLGPGPKEHRNAPGTRGHSTRTVSTVPCLMKDASKRAYVSQKLKMMPIYPPRRHGDHGERQFESEDYLMWVVLCHRGHRGNRDGATAVGGLRPPSFLTKRFSPADDYQKMWRQGKFERCKSVKPELTAAGAYSASPSRQQQSNSPFQDATPRFHVRFAISKLVTAYPCPFLLVGHSRSSIAPGANTLSCGQSCRYPPATCAR